jgi:L-iditol 2-dehydrogenase
MKAAFLCGIGDLRIIDIEEPVPGPNDVLVRVRACGVCPTDVSAWIEGPHTHETSYPRPLGHEWAGDIVEVGKNVKKFRKGMRIVGAGGTGFAKYTCISEDSLSLSRGVVVIPENVSYDEATFSEPLADCLHAVVDQCQVKIGDYIVIIGAGQMGLQQMMVAKNFGATPIMVEMLKSRIEFAKDLGAEFVIDPSKEDAVERVKEITNGEGAQSAIVTIGNPLAINQAIKTVGAGGRVVIFGGAPLGTVLELDPNIIHYSEIYLTGSSGVGYWYGLTEIQTGTPIRRNMILYQAALKFIADGKIPISKLITHRFPLDDISKAFEIIRDKKGIKAIILP